MFGAWLKLLPSSNRPTARTLRALSCPPRSLVPSAQFPSCRLPRTQSGLRQDAISVIALNPPYDGRTSRSVESRFGVKKRPIGSQLNCGVSALRMQTQGQSPRSPRSTNSGAPPRNRTFDAKCGVFSLLVTEQWRNGGDVGRGFRWKRLARREVLFISRRTCVICRKEAC
jgi:hypothetical protein